MAIVESNTVRWQQVSLTDFIHKSFTTLRARKKAVGERSPWWAFIFSWAKHEQREIEKFIKGEYRFDPLETYAMPDETITVWNYKDRLFVRALLYLIKPLFKHIIPASCVHLVGPSGVKTALDLLQRALATGKYRYFMRIDIKNYYASMEHKILIEQTQRYFKDSRVLNYLEQIITIPILNKGMINISKRGIPRRSSLSLW